MKINYCNIYKDKQLGGIYPSLNTARQGCFTKVNGKEVTREEILIGTLEITSNNKGVAKIKLIDPNDQY